MFETMQNMLLAYADQSQNLIDLVNTLLVGEHQMIPDLADSWLTQSCSTSLKYAALQFFYYLLYSSEDRREYIALKYHIIDYCYQTLSSQGVECDQAKEIFETLTLVLLRSNAFFDGIQENEDQFVDEQEVNMGAVSHFQKIGGFEFANELDLEDNDDDMATTFFRRFSPHMQSENCQTSVF